MTAVTPILDCRGQQCPAPILTTARAAKKLGSRGGTLEILSDDAAFPLDLESWCRSSGAHLISLDDEGGTYRASVQIGGPRGTLEIPNTLEAQSPVPPLRIDCRGLECPQPILEVARAARREGGRELEVFADDQAFEVDIASWCRSSGAELVSLEQRAGVFRAVIRPRASAPAEARVSHGTAALSVPPRPETGELSGARPLSSLHGEPILAPVSRPHSGIGPSLSNVAERPNDVPLTGDFGKAPTLPDHPRPSIPQPSRTPAEIDATPKIDLCNVPPNERLAALERALLAAPCEAFVVISPDRTFTPKLMTWCTQAGYTLTSLSGRGPVLAEVERSGFTLSANTQPHLALVPTASGETHLAPTKPRRATLLVLHSDKEALLAALIVANGAAASGMEVEMFFTFWGLNLLRGDKPNKAYPRAKVTWAQRLFKWLMPRGPRRQALGQLNFGGMGAGMLSTLMKKKNIMDLPELMLAAQDQGIQFTACTMSMEVMGISQRDLHPYPNLKLGGVASFVGHAADSELSLVF